MRDSGITLTPRPSPLAPRPSLKVDIDSWSRGQLVAALEARGVPLPAGGHKEPPVHALRDVLRPTLGACVNDASEWPKARCVEAVRAHGLPMPEGAEKPPTANELKETLRPAVQPGACTPTLVLPTGHAQPRLGGP